MSAVTQHRYEKIADNLQRRIARGEFTVSGKLPSEHDLAGEFSVNRLTLRKAVSLLEEAGLVTRHRGRGTFIGAAPVAAESVRNFVFVGNIREHIWSDIYAELGAELQKQGHRLNCYQPSGTGFEPEFSTWLQAHTEKPALICQHDCISMIESHVKALECSMVVLDLSAVEDKACDFPKVMPDMRRAGFMAAEHLIGCGHEKIAFLGYGSDPAPVPGFFLPFDENLAFAGYQEAMRRARLPMRELAIGTYGGGEELQVQIECFLKHRRAVPSAFVCQQDFKARDILAVAAARGLAVPGDLSIVSIGNTPWAEAMTPALTSIDLQPRAMAQLALHILQTDESRISNVYRIEPKLVSRESVCRRKLK